MGDIPDYSVQPRPQTVDGAVSLHDLVAEDLRRLHLPEADEAPALAWVLGRKEYGLEKYGTVLHVDNGRDFLLDSSDEAGDLAPYLRGVLNKHPDLAVELEQDYWQVLLVMAKLSRLLADRQKDSDG